MECSTSFQNSFIDKYKIIFKAKKRNNHENKKILTVLLAIFSAHQTTLTIDPLLLKDQQEVYSFNNTGMYNPLIASNATFKTIGTISVDAASGNKTLMIDSKNYLLTADKNATVLGCVESKYSSISSIDKLKSIMGDSEYNLLYTTEGFGSVLTGGTLAGLNTGAMLQTYTTAEGGYIAFLGKNKNGSQNGDTVTYSGESYYTLYSPVYGTLIS